MNKGACIIGQSGGPTAVINSSVLGIIEKSLKENAFSAVYGALNGINGIIEEEIIDFSDYSLEELQLLKTTPSAILGSVRKKLPDNLQDEAFKKVEEVFIKYNIRCFFYIGGNDSMDTCLKLSKYFKNSTHKCIVIGIPKTIDNDMLEIDHTPGYASACKFIYTTLSEIYEDINCYKKGRVTIVEIMGRDSGWLTCAAKIASYYGKGPDLIYIPEGRFDINQFLKDVESIYLKKSKVLVAVSEGIRDINGDYLLQSHINNNADHFGHVQLGGIGSVLAEIVNKKLGLQVRSVELNILQRCASHLLSKTDVEEAYNCGSYGVELYLQGLTGQMVSMRRKDGNDYEIEYYPVDLEKIANFVKTVPTEYITEFNNNINDEFLNYLLPLVQGEINLPFENGFPKYFKLRK